MPFSKMLIPEFFLIAYFDNDTLYFTSNDTSLYDFTIRNDQRKLHRDCLISSNFYDIQILISNFEFNWLFNLRTIRAHSRHVLFKFYKIKIKKIISI